MQSSPGASVFRKQRLLRPAALTAVIFFSVSGGPYGLEPVIHLAGERNAFLLVLITPLVWAVPVILMMLELNGMMPRTGGYYQWVKTGLGPRWGFLEGWWTWLYMFVDLAIYPVLFVEYCSFFFPGVSAFSYGICCCIVWGCAILNLLGVLPVGRSSVAFGTAVVFPFVVLFIVAFRGGVSLSFTGAAGGVASPATASAGMALVVVMWNYLGWDNSSTFADEVDRPVRSYLVSLASAFVLIVTTYALSVYAAAGSGIDPATLETEGFPSLGLLLGGRELAGLLAAGGMASALGLFVSNLLSVSRLPKAMADDGYLPPLLRSVSRGRGTPYVSIVACAVIVSAMVLWHFEDLLIIDVGLYSCALFLEFFALVRLRKTRPEMPRPFRIPLSGGGLVALSALPALCFLAGIAGFAASGGVHTGALLFTLLSLGSAPVAWLLASRRRAAEGT